MVIVGDAGVSGTRESAVETLVVRDTEHPNSVQTSTDTLYITAPSRPFTSTETVLFDKSRTTTDAKRTPFSSSTITVMFCTDPPLRPEEGTVVVTMIVPRSTTVTLGASLASGVVVATRLVYTEPALVGDAGTDTGLALGSQQVHSSVLYDQLKVAPHTLLAPTVLEHSATVAVVPKLASMVLHTCPDDASVLLAVPGSFDTTTVTDDDRLQPFSVHTTVSTSYVPDPFNPSIVKEAPLLPDVSFTTTRTPSMYTLMF